MKRSIVALVRAGSSDSPTMRSARSLASAPTSWLSAAFAAAVSVAILVCACSVTVRAACSASVRASATIEARWACPSARRRAASARASASWARYCSSSSAASARSRSACSSLFSMPSVRVSSAFCICGSTNFQNNQKMIANATADQTMS